MSIICCLICHNDQLIQLFRITDLLKCQMQTNKYTHKEIEIERERRHIYNYLNTRKKIDVKINDDAIFSPSSWFFMMLSPSSVWCINGKWSIDSFQ